MSPPLPPPTTPDSSGIGSGQNLPRSILVLATMSALFATLLSFYTINLQLRNYRKINLQRFTVRILVMVPVYALSSLISLYSLDLAFFLDAIRDIYEAFVIYCFFTLLVEYLGGERSLLILLHGRPPIPHPFPVSLLYSPIDVSDPFTYLALKRGILQYVQLKPLLTAITLILKITGTYRDGSIEADGGYFYISMATNASVTLSLYCLVLFWRATHDDLLPFRPMPKFLCVKGIIFFSFWQGLAVSILVAIGVVRSTRFPTEMLSLAIQDTIICFEMPFFAFMHMFAFSHTDYIDQNIIFAGRLPFWYALRDAFGLKDVVRDSLTTVKGSGFSYRTFEPAAGVVHHQGAGRERRIRAGLRFTEGGKGKYWLPVVGDESDAYGRKGKSDLIVRPIHGIKRIIEERVRGEEGYAPVSEAEANEVVHRDDGEHGLEHESEEYQAEWRKWKEGEGREYDDESESDAESLGFGEAKDEDMEALYKDSRRLVYGDFNYPILDASREDQRRRMREEEDGIIHNHKRVKGKGRQTLLAQPTPQHRSSYGRLAESSSSSEPSGSNGESSRAAHPEPEGAGVLRAARTFVKDVLGGSDSEEEAEILQRREQEEKSRLPSDAIDLMVVDEAAEDEEMVRSRRKGEPAGKKKRVYRQTYTPIPSSPAVVSSSSLSVSNAVTVEVKDTIQARVNGSNEETEVVRLIVQEREIESKESSEANPWKD